MSAPLIRFDPVSLPPSAEAMRGRVRAFLQREQDTGGFEPGDFMRHVPEFSRRCGEAGLIGMSWPREHGGHGHTFLERYVATEELLAAGAPIWAHWVADRQSGPVLMRYGSPELSAGILPRIVRGECYFCIGMSEPGSGSDLFSVRSKAEKTDDGWRVNGRKLWTSNAAESHYMIALLRTSPPREDDRRFGLSQFLIDMTSPGLVVRPVEDMAGGRSFNEVTFDDVMVPENHLIGEADQGWKQVTGELAFERAGPERFLETLYVLKELIRAAGEAPDARMAEGIGRLTADLWTLRQLSLSVAAMLEAGHLPETEAALVKDLGTNWEQALPAVARDLLPLSRTSGNSRFAEAVIKGTLVAPKLTIQGGTREVLRGIIARGLGLR